MKPSVVLHIGSSKTGTTAIQKSLHAGVAGVHYVLFGRQADTKLVSSHNPLFKELNAIDFDQKVGHLSLDLQEEIARRNDQHSFISCEFFSQKRFLEVGPGRLKSLLEGFDVKVLFLVIDRVKHFESSYLQVCKRGSFFGSATDYISNYKRNNGPTYLEVVEAYAQAFGAASVLICNYDAIKDKLVSSALLTAGIKIDEPGIRMFNESLHASSALVIQCLYSKLMAEGISLTDTIKQRMIGACRQVGNPAETVLTETLIDKLEEAYATADRDLSMTDYQLWRSTVSQLNYVSRGDIEVRFGDFIAAALRF
jgi:hypothetical protein